MKYAIFDVGAREYRLALIDTETKELKKISNTVFKDLVKTAEDLGAEKENMYVDYRYKFKPIERTCKDLGLKYYRTEENVKTGLTEHKVFGKVLVVNDTRNEVDYDDIFEDVVFVAEYLTTQLNYKLKYNPRSKREY